ncbi:MAG: hypothetical protein HN348_32425 [Proteobacteria bacterium]|nr:hypothetical protein [Pseudomonadota bacterium]
MSRSSLIFFLVLACCSDPDTVLDADGDGTVKADDCDDKNANIHPGALEICNGVDDDCDGTTDDDAPAKRLWYPDTDGDGYGDPDGENQSACTAPVGYANNLWDCDDTNPEVHPGVLEICDNIDNDCDYHIDELPCVDTGGADTGR